MNIRFGAELAASVAMHEKLRSFPRAAGNEMDDVPQRNVELLFTRLKAAEFFVPARVGCDRGQDISTAAKAAAVDTMLSLSEQHPEWIAEDIVRCAWLHTVRAFADFADSPADDEILDLHALQRLISPMLNISGAVDFLHGQRGHPL